ncbi:UNVERIFIED_CONTAM: hypothetical protein Sradi_4432000 [Sesamum radiatum]|uniref:Mitochondrial protein n=1 Tax=Sesamum radiatum TaxID=300843 RepID=A0AAW2NQ69_SESRA
MPFPSSTSPLVPISKHSSRPLQVYVRRRQVPSTTLDDSAHPLSLATAPPSSLPTQPDTDLPIALCKAVLHPEWKLAMDEEISALISRGTWKLVSAPVDADVVSCRWVFTLKYQVDASMIVIRPVWLPRVTLKLMELTILRYSLLLLVQFHSSPNILGNQSGLAYVSDGRKECISVW